MPRIVSSDMTQLHANCVAFDGQGVLLRGPSGSGKSDLSLRLVSRGAQLVSDDRTDIFIQDGKLQATAPETLIGMIEVRGIGIVAGLAQCSQAEIRVIVDLVEPGAHDIIARMPEPATETLHGVNVPLWKFFAFENSAPDKIETVLALATGKMRIVS
ncbi:hypothetical protein TH25_20730 [Thalassospira profundimaris]|uniref:HPr kinase/phosphorylase C-terminal domain-containing protein n=2 Tax=Thalassospira profundimaris TaxID=502049 RepID=A0A367WR02_9PROT|nr:hypothetical protein TH25_20730 [Thalassospira profundimaris]